MKIMVNKFRNTTCQINFFNVLPHLLRVHKLKSTAWNRKERHCSYFQQRVVTKLFRTEFTLQLAILTGHRSGPIFSMNDANTFGCSLGSLVSLCLNYLYTLSLISVLDSCEVCP